MNSKQILTLMVLGLTASTTRGSIAYVGGDQAYEPVIAASDSLTVSSFAAGTSNYIVVAVASKLHTDTNNPVNGVTYDGTPLSYVGAQYVDDSYEGWATLYAGVAGVAAGDVVVDYSTPNSSDAHDGIGVCVSSWSGVGTAGAVSVGNTYVSANDGPLADSITTTENGAVIVSSFMLGSDATTLVPPAATTVRVNGGGEKVDSVLTSVEATTIGTYAPELDWTGTTRRNAVISMELVPGSLTQPSGTVQPVEKGWAYEEVTNTTPDSLTLTAFAAGLDNYVTVAVVTKLVDSDAANPVTDVTYAGNSLRPIGAETVSAGGFACWTLLYAGRATSAAGDVVVSYDVATSSSAGDSIACSAASWSGATGVGIVSRGNTAVIAAGVPGGPLSDTTVTTEDGSLLVSSFILGDNGGVLTPSNLTVHTASGIGTVQNVLTWSDAAAVGTKSVGLDWAEATRRNAVISAEILPSRAAPGIKYMNGGYAYDGFTSTGAASLTVTNFNAGAGNCLTVAVATKVKDYTNNVVTGVTYAGSPVPLIADQLVDDSAGSYDGHALLYGVKVNAKIGTVVVNYLSPPADDHDAICVSVASWAGTDGATTVSSGDTSTGNSGPRTDSITTAGARSVIVSSFMMGGDAGALTPVNITIRVDNQGEKAIGMLTSLPAATAGVYAPQLDWTGSVGRSAVISAELDATPVMHGTVIIIR